MCFVNNFHVELLEERAGVTILILKKHNLLLNSKIFLEVRH
jgi:hypothetical protein